MTTTNTAITTLHAMSMSVGAARAVLARCRDATELRDVIAQGNATIRYLKEVHGASEEVVFNASEIVLWAGRRLGEVLRDQPKHPGGRPLKTSRAARQVSTLAETGISRDRAAKFQLLAAMPEKAFMRYMASARAAEIVPTIAAALRADQRAKKARYTAPPKGRYDVVVLDPPWETAWRAGRQYPTMSLREIAALELPFADDAWLFCWATQRFLPAALQIIAGWSLTYSFTMTWHKTGRCLKPWGLPRFNSEFCVVARKGSPRFVDVAQFDTCFDAPPGAHSEKPQAFYDLLRRVTPGRRIDMYNRRRIEGFDGWGDQSPARPARPTRPMSSSPQHRREQCG